MPNNAKSQTSPPKKKKKYSYVDLPPYYNPEKKKTILQKHRRGVKIDQNVKHSFSNSLSKTVEKSLSPKRRKVEMNNVKSQCTRCYYIASDAAFCQIINIEQKLQ